MDLITIIAAVLSSLLTGGVFGFIQFMVTRHDSKNDQIANLATALADTNKRLDNIEQEHRDSMDLRDAKDARRRILRFSDECRNKSRHSLEMFVNVLDDITFYNTYCEEHPKFENARTVDAEKFIRDEYNECLRENSFL